MELAHHLNQALKAHVLMKRDWIMWSKTARLLLWTSLQDGLCSAAATARGRTRLSSKRRQSCPESRTLASITFQNYFRMKNSPDDRNSRDRRRIPQDLRYGCGCHSTNKQMIRKDIPDAVYRTERGKFKSVVEEIARYMKKGSWFWWGPFHQI